MFESVSMRDIHVREEPAQLLQLEPDKGAAYGRLAPYAWLREPDCIAILDPELIAEAFRSPLLHAVDYAGINEGVAARTGIDLSMMVTALRQVPLAQEGCPHRDLRQEFARVLAGKPAELAPLVDARMASIVAAHFAAGARVDLVADVALPLYEAVFANLLGVSPSVFAQDHDYSQVFDGMMSLNRRRKLNASLARVHDRLGEHTPAGMSRETALALMILGRDALIGTVVNSLWHEISAHPGKRLAQIDFGGVPASTSVPFIEREATEEMELGPLRLAKGQRVRLMLDATTREMAGRDAGLTFGKGRHLCLGRPLALAVWSAMGRALRRVELVAVPLELTHRAGDYVFNYPERAWVGFDG